MFSNAIKRNIVKACASKSKLPLSKTLLAASLKVSPLQNHTFSTSTRRLEDVPKTASVIRTEDGVVRPLSPDLAIWRFSTTAYLHVGIRITGVALGAGFAATGLYGLFDCNIPAALDSFKVAAPALVPILKFCVAAPLTYHTLGGYRQLYHDFTSKGINNEFQDKSSLAMLGGAAFVGLAAMFYSYE